MVISELNKMLEEAGDKFTEMSRGSRWHALALATLVIGGFVAVAPAAWIISFGGTADSLIGAGLWAFGVATATVFLASWWYLLYYLETCARCLLDMHRDVPLPDLIESYGDQITALLKHQR